MLVVFLGMTLIIFAVSIFLIFKLAKFSGLDLKLSSLVLCGVWALLINFGSIYLSPFLTKSYFITLGSMILMAAISTTCYNRFWETHRHRLPAIPLPVAVDKEELLEMAQLTTATPTVAEPEPIVKPEPIVAVEPEPIIEPEPIEIVAPEPVVEPEPIVEVEPEPVVEPEPMVEVEPEPVIEPEPIVEVEPEPVIEPEPMVEVEPEPVIEPEPIVEVEPEPVVEPEPIVEEVEPEPIIEPEPIAEVEPEPIIEPEPIEVEPAPIIEPEPIEVEPEPVAEPEPMVEVEPEPVIEPEPIVEVEPEPVIEPEPMVEIEPEPVVEPEPIVEVEPEPVVEPEPIEVEPEPVVEEFESVASDASLDTLLDLAFAKVQAKDFIQAIHLYQLALANYGQDSYAPFVVIEIVNIYKTLGQYQKAIDTYQESLKLPALQENQPMCKQFTDNCLYLSSIIDTLHSETTETIPFNEISKETMLQIEAAYQAKQSCK